MGIQLAYPIGCVQEFALQIHIQLRHKRIRISALYGAVPKAQPSVRTEDPDPFGNGPFLLPGGHEQKGIKSSDGIKAFICKGKGGGVHAKLCAGIRRFVQFLLPVVYGGDPGAVQAADDPFPASAYIQNGAGKLLFQCDLHPVTP